LNVGEGNFSDLNFRVTDNNLSGAPSVVFAGCKTVFTFEMVVILDDSGMRSLLFIEDIGE
jgi:hypothetical protein